MFVWFLSEVARSIFKVPLSVRKKTDKKPESGYPYKICQSNISKEIWRQAPSVLVANLDSLVAE